jgi:hypothetical protein
MSPSLWEEAAKRLQTEVERLSKLIVSGFYEDATPQFRQGLPTNELQSVVTAEEVAGYVAERDAAYSEQDYLQCNEEELRDENERLCAEVERLRRENESLGADLNLCISEASMLRRDALRYRWLRIARDSTEDGTIDVVLWKGFQMTGLRMDTLDAAIDAAMESKT